MDLDAIRPDEETQEWCESSVHIGMAWLRSNTLLDERSAMLIEAIDKLLNLDKMRLTEREKVAGMANALTSITALAQVYLEDQVTAVVLDGGELLPPTRVERMLASLKEISLNA